MPLTEQEIYERLSNGQVRPVISPEDARGRRAAVLVPLVRIEEDWHILYIRRTELVADHKGQVAFPGGAMDPEDTSIEQTALREAWEEVGLQPETVRILGKLPDFYTISDYLITPVVGVVGWPFEFLLSVDEVTRAFTIPLHWLADPANYEERPYARPNGVHQHVIFFKEYDGELLWGATARITLTFLEFLGLQNTK